MGAVLLAPACLPLPCPGYCLAAWAWPGCCVSVWALCGLLLCGCVGVWALLAREIGGKSPQIFDTQNRREGLDARAAVGL